MALARATNATTASSSTGKSFFAKVQSACSIIAKLAFTQGHGSAIAAEKASSTTRKRLSATTSVVKYKTVKTVLSRAS